MKKIVLICCNNKYVPKSIVALHQFCSYNPDYIKIILGSSFKNESRLLCNKFDIKLISINLFNDFINLDKRPYGKNYPIECFYHFYAYKLFKDYDFIVKIEPDIITNKKIDINLNLIKYIGGSYAQDTTINNFVAIKKDYNKIKKAFNSGNINQHRILGGAIIYNIKNLWNINFYEKIIKYYKKSLEINAPRCGDDSLMVMYQLLNPSHITLFEQKFHVVFYNKLKNIKLDNITFFHLIHPIKYWTIKNENKLNNIQRFFYNNIIEYIYNNFKIEFIKKYLPEIYLDISNVKIPFFYYNGEDNFGDLITPYLLNKHCDKKSYTFNFSNKTCKIISCGSIMRLCNKKTIVYGSGIRDINQNIKKGIIQIVRGPLTRKRLLKIGCYCPPIYGDPGLLLPLYYNPKIKKTYKIGIIPHYIHYDIINNMYKNLKEIKVIKLINKNIENVIDDILRCNKTISSSLHGLIVSDAYNIPNKWVLFNNNIKGDNTKYYDYFKSVNRKDTTYINCMNYKKIPKNTYDLIKNVNISFDINFLQKKFFMNKKGIKNYTKYLYVKNFNINNNTKILNNEWLAFKKHWNILDNILISNQETYLKKNILHSSKLKKKYKIKIQKNKKVKFIKLFDNNYYLISL